MSPRRRQETLERFSVPLGDDVQMVAAAGVFPLTTQKRTRTSRAAIIGDSDEAYIDTDASADFPVEVGVSDEDFVVDDDDSVWNKKIEGKGKGKAKKTSKKGRVS